MRSYRTDAANLKQSARGRELEILERVAGIPRELLDKRGHACPKCGGTDRFSLIDAQAGAVMCRKCFATGNGDFLAAVMWACGVDFNVACRRVAKYLGIDGNGKPARQNGKPNKPSGARSKLFATAAAAVSALETQHGPHTAIWTYHDSDGKPAGLIVRWDRGDGRKNILPVSKYGDGWQAPKGMPEPRPLYRLPSIDAAEWVIVCEGEKAADSAATLGYVATTSPHGCQSATKADWEPLAGKQVVIQPDADDAGRKYAEQVAGIVTTLTPAASVRIVTLPGLADGEDIVEWIAAGGTREQLQELIDAAPTWMPPAEERTAPVDRIGPFIPFPLHHLPEPIRSYADAAAAALGTDPSFIALPLLAALGSAIGNTRRILLKKSWREPPILWTAIVGDSGTLKTPSLSAATDRLEWIQNKHLAEHAAAMDLFTVAQVTHEAELAAWKRNKGVRSGPPEAPKQPILTRVVVSETTVEALADRLQHAPRGLLLARDELAGWLQSFGQYKGGKGGDVAHWLSMYNAKPLRIDRKTGATFTFVPSAAVSIAGGIQPDTLRRCLSTEHFENGLAARLLLAFPPKRPRVWSEDAIDERLQRRVADLFDALLALDFTADDDGNKVAVDVPLDREAKREWIAFYDRHGAEQAGLTGREAALWSKLEGTAPRLALIVHLVRIAAGDGMASPELIDAVSMTAGTALADWFGHEAKRVYAALSETEEQRDLRHLVELVRRIGGTVTARELMRRCRKYGTSDDAEAALDSLAKAKFGCWDVDVPDSQGGRPAHRFRLYATVDVDTTPRTAAKNEVVSLSTPRDTVRAPSVDDADNDNEVVEWTA